MSDSALILFEDGSIIRGSSCGVCGMVAGEVVFNTAMSGYQEIFTDPSYCQQIVVMTAPHIGNVGCNSHDNESEQVFLSGVVLRDAVQHSDNFRAEQTLQDFFRANNVIAIDQVDTRALTRTVRDQGAMRAVLCAGDRYINNVDAARNMLNGFSGLKGADLAKVVSTKASYTWHEAGYDYLTDTTSTPDGDYHVVAYDFGIKKNILRLLVAQGARVTVVPAQTTADEVLGLAPDGIFLSNGPGDPEACTYAIDAIHTLIETRIPVFGICLGAQLLTLACGGTTKKMKFGHHGANHPVRNSDGTIMITSQNHGFCISETQLPDTLEITHRSLFDDTIQGVRHVSFPVFGFQGHPEASPGPHDIRGLFAQFAAMIRSAKQNDQQSTTHAKK